MKQVFNLTVILSLIFSYNNCSAQTDSSKKKSYFKLNLNYLSNAVYFGRKDSAVVPYLRSSITYFDKSGFYAGTGVAMLVSPDEPKRIDLINVDAGYSFSIKKLDAGIYASKFFYSNASFAVGSELKGMIGAYAGYDLGVINVNVGGDILFSTNTDYSSSLGLSHPFESGEENKKWTITPTLQMNAGTQYFNEAYYEFRKFTFTTAASNSGSGNSSSSNSSGKGKGHSNSSNSGSGSSTTTTTIKTLTFYDKNKFTILDYELSVPINYETKHWGIYTNPVVAFPTSAASYAIDNVLQKEKLSTAFFIEIGGYIKF